MRLPVRVGAFFLYALNPDGGGHVVLSFNSMYILHFNIAIIFKLPNGKMIIFLAD
jgi:hypothetical protein